MYTKRIVNDFCLAIWAAMTCVGIGSIYATELNNCPALLAQIVRYTARSPLREHRGTGTWILIEASPTQITLHFPHISKKNSYPLLKEIIGKFSRGFPRDAFAIQNGNVVINLEKIPLQLRTFLDHSIKDLVEWSGLGEPLRFNRALVDAGKIFWDGKTWIDSGDGGDLAASAVTEIRAVIADVNDLLGPDIQRPPQVKLNIQKVGMPMKHYFSNLIDVPYQLTQNGNPKHARIVQAHEYGHLIFELTIANRFGSSLPEEMIDLMQPYDEFFADVIAVVYAGDLRAAAKASRAIDSTPLSWAARQENGVINPRTDSDNARSFENRLSLEGWQEIEAHLLLAPARGILGRQHLRRLDNKPRTQKFLNAIIDSIEVELRARVTNHGLSPEEINNRFITEVNRRML